MLANAGTPTRSAGTKVTAGERGRMAVVQVAFVGLRWRVADVTAAARVRMPVTFRMAAAAV